MRRAEVKLVHWYKETIRHFWCRRRVCERQFCPHLYALAEQADVVKRRPRVVSSETITLGVRGSTIHGSGLAQQRYSSQ